MKGVNKKTHLVNDSGEADTAVETVGGNRERSGEGGERGRGRGRGETILGEMGGDDDRRSEDVEVAEDDGGEEEEEDVPKLYEVEAIRRKRVHKGKVQYLIKWRGWPETSNTWEPLKNVETISKWIDAFEEKLRKADRKRKAKSGGSKSQLKNKNKKKKKTSHVEPNSRSVVGVARQAGLTEEEKEYDPTLNELRGTPGGGIGSKGDNKVRTNGLLRVKRKKRGLVGAKRRKSGIVKRYIPDENKTPDSTITTLAPGAFDLNNQPHESKMEEPDIVRIIKPVGVSTKQDSLVTFSALRSDGEEVKVDSKFLRVHNPNLLLDFYEQHITYKPESEEKCV